MAVTTQKTRTKTSRKRTTSKKAAATSSTQTDEKKLTLPERYARLQRIVYLRLSFPSRSWDEIGADERVGLERSQCQALWKEWCDHDKAVLRGEDPETVVHEHIAGFRLLREQAAALAERAGVADNTVLAAIKLIYELRDREIRMRQETGFLPKELGKIRWEIDVRFIVDKVIDILERNKVPKGEIAELVELLDDDGALFGSDASA